jgi:hypothetical protein
MGRDRQPEPARLGDLEDAAAPVDVVRLAVERDTGRPGPARELVDVLGRGDVEPQADALDAIAALLPVVM